MKQKILKLLSEGKSQKEVVRLLGCSSATVWYHSSDKAKAIVLRNNAKNKTDSKRRLKEEFGGKCMCCGYNKSFRALHFHHKDPSKKDDDINSLVSRGQITQAREEAKKCVLVCANCHAEIHEGIRTI